jgi:hypothetical protein
MIIWDILGELDLPALLEPLIDILNACIYVHNRTIVPFWERIYIPLGNLVEFFVAVFLLLFLNYWYLTLPLLVVCGLCELHRQSRQWVPVKSSLSPSQRRRRSS